MKSSAVLAVLLTLVSMLLFQLSPLLGKRAVFSGVVYAETDWKKEFEDICSKTQDAMVYSPEELRAFIERCDKIKPLIERLDDSQRKVYLRRLQMCRDLFAFALESKEKK